MRHFRRHADALAQRGMRMDRLADIDRVGAHLDRQRHFADHVAGVCADHAAAHDLAVAVRLGAVIEQQLGKAFVAPVGNGAARRCPGKQAFFDLDALRLSLVFGQADPGDFRVGIGNARNPRALKGALPSSLLPCISPAVTSAAICASCTALCASIG